MKTDSPGKDDKPAPPAPAPKPARGSSRIRTFFNGFAVGVFVTSVLAWYFLQQARRNPQAQQRFEEASTQTADAAGETIYQAAEALKAKMETLDLKPEQVREELGRTGKIVRRRAREIAGTVADATADARITAAIKARIAADKELSVWTISVSTSDGRVTLDGSVSAADHVAKAVALAMETDNVRDVTSNLKVDEKQPAKTGEQKP